MQTSRSQEKAAAKQSLKHASRILRYGSGSTDGYPPLHASRLLYNGHGFTDDGLRLHSPEAEARTSSRDGNRRASRGRHVMSKGSLHIGTSGWHYASWWGPFYPQGLRKAEALPYY